jgi:hypothetical protein
VRARDTHRDVDDLQLSQRKVLIDRSDIVALRAKFIAMRYASC